MHKLQENQEWPAELLGVTEVCNVPNKRASIVRYSVVKGLQIFFYADTFLIWMEYFPFTILHSLPVS